MSRAEDMISTVQIDDGAPRFYQHDDIGNGMRFADQHRSHVRYCAEWKTWLVWDGQRWQQDTGAVRVTALAKGTVASIIDDLDRLRLDLHGAVGNEAETDRISKLITSLTRHVKRSASEPGLRAMLRLAESEPGIAIQPGDLDAEVHILNTPSGIVDLRTGELWPHDPDKLCTRITAVPYNPAAVGVFWLKTLAIVFGHDSHLARYLQRIIGLAVLGNPGERILPVGDGPGGTGKTTVCEAIVRVLGDYGNVGDARAILLAKDGTGPNENIADLHGRRLVLLAELPSGQLNTTRIKKLTGGDQISAHRKFQHVFTFAPTHTFLVYTNDLPEVPESGTAIWDRLRVLPFTHVFDGDRLPRAEVTRRLAAEAEAVLAWCVQGAVEYHQDGLGDIPESVQAATRAYRQDEDAVGLFLDDEAVLDDAAWEPIGALYARFREWCKATGREAEGQRWLGNRLVEHGLPRQRRDAGRGHRGAQLRGHDA